MSVFKYVLVVASTLSLSACKTADIVFHVLDAISN